jgi:hypothetical protein
VSAGDFLLRRTNSEHARQAAPFVPEAQRSGGASEPLIIDYGLWQSKEVTSPNLHRAQSLAGFMAKFRITSWTLCVLVA